MKKCDHCGAVQSDSRTACMDCGELLGRPMPADEAEQYEAEMSDTLAAMSERTEDFYVSPLHRVLGIFSIAATVALLVMLVWMAGEIEELSSDFPGTVVAGGNAFIVSNGDSAIWKELEYRSAEQRELERAVIYALFGIVSFGSAAVFFLFPRVMWSIETLRFRLWYDIDPSPSYFATLVYAVIKYSLFAIGCGALIAVLLAIF